MPKILIINSSNLGNFFPENTRRPRTALKNKTLRAGKYFQRQKMINSKSGNVSISFMNISFILISIVAFFGAFYLYQVNDLISKGYEIKALKNQIQNGQEISQKNKIKEVELQSMYNIEKSAQNLNLISSDGASYLEINESVAMK